MFLAGGTRTGPRPGSRHRAAVAGQCRAVFGALITPNRLSHLSVGGWVAVLAILLVRPFAILVSLQRTPMSDRERVTAAWFGPKGFASVVYGLLALRFGIADSELVFDLVAVTIAQHSATDVRIAKMLQVEPPNILRTGRPERVDRREDRGRNEP